MRDYFYIVVPLPPYYILIFLLKIEILARPSSAISARGLSEKKRFLGWYVCLPVCLSVYSITFERINRLDRNKDPAPKCTKNGLMIKNSKKIFFLYAWSSTYKSFSQIYHRVFEEKKHFAKLSIFPLKYM